MIRFPNIDPVAISIGPLDVHWYGLSYLVGIGLGWIYLLKIRNRSTVEWSRDAVGDVVFYAALGAVLGGRIGYTIFYNFSQTLDSPLSIFQVWNGGMSFHGGVIGFILAVVLYARKRNLRFVEVTDFVVCAVPIGLFFGRVANFVNQELWGAPSSLPWAVVFSHPAAGDIARHPSQLYEAMLEGIVLFLLLSVISKQKQPVGVLSGVFLLGYGCFRFLIEFVREPDQHIGYLFSNWVTMGQVLSLPMIIAGVGILFLANKRMIPTSLQG